MDTSVITWLLTPLLVLGLEAPLMAEDTETQVLVLVPKEGETTFKDAKWFCAYRNGELEYCHGEIREDYYYERGGMVVPLAVVFDQLAATPAGHTDVFSSTACAGPDGPCVDSSNTTTRGWCSKPRRMIVGHQVRRKTQLAEQCLWRPESHAAWCENGTRVLRQHTASYRIWDCVEAVREEEDD